MNSYANFFLLLLLLLLLLSLFDWFDTNNNRCDEKMIIYIWILNFIFVNFHSGYFFMLDKIRKIPQFILGGGWLHGKLTPAWKSLFSCRYENPVWVTCIVSDRHGFAISDRTRIFFMPRAAEANKDTVTFILRKKTYLWKYSSTERERRDKKMGDDRNLIVLQRLHTR